MTKTIRRIKPYPTRSKWTGIKRLKRGSAKWELLRQKRPRRHARPWRYKTRHDPQATQEQAAVQGIKGSLPERIFYKSLIDWGFVDGVDFTFQASYMGGRAELGGLVADFMFPEPKIIVQIQSVWHTMTLAIRRRDEDQRMLLENSGWQVMELWPEIIENPVALDDWIKANLMLQWGTSTLGFYPTGSSRGWMDFANDLILDRIEQGLDSIIWTLNN